MSQTEINQNVQINVFIAVALSTALFSIVALFYGEYLSSGTGLIFALLIWLRTQKKRLTEKNPFIHRWLAHVIVALLGVATILSAITEGSYAANWAYAFPVITFFIYPIRQSSVIALLHCVGFIFMITNFFHGPEKIQLLINYLFCLILTGAFVYLREEREKQLKPLRRTDNLTLASTREHLADDLTREILRSEREGTSLSMLATSIDPDFMGSLSPGDSELVLKKLGKMLHESLRPFDTYYRYEQAQFLIILPLIGTREAFKKAEAIRLRCKKSLRIDDAMMTVSVGVAGLNVGDDSATMIQKAILALRQAQSGGKNRTSSYTDKETAQGVI
jgi:diguanylate cyclase (GGDEF)-like protein